MSGVHTALTVGIDLPGDFPLSEYNGVHDKVAPLQPQFTEAFRHYAGAWNAVAFRYRAAAESDDSYKEATAKPSTSLQRYAQEVALFGFFANAIATLDSLAYGAHAIGATMDPLSFALTADTLRHVGLHTAAAHFSRAFPSDPVGTALFGIANDPVHIEMREIRNALSHRSASARAFELSVGTRAPQSERWLVDHLQLKSGIQSIAIDAGTTARHRAWLSRQLLHTVGAMRQFCSAHL